MISYEKYTNMSRRQLLNSLLSAEKKEQKIKASLSENSELIKFLKSKLKESLKTPKHYTLETSIAMKEMKRWEKENPQEAQQVRQELKEEMSAYYENHHSAQG